MRIGTLITLLILGLSNQISAQVISPQQLAYLRSQFLESVAETVPGETITIGSLPPNRIDGPVPASLLDEGDPVALPLAQANETAISNLSSGTGTDISVLEARASALESRTSVLESEPVLIPVGITTNLEFISTGPVTNTLIFVNGVLTGATQEGP